MNAVSDKLGHSCKTGFLASGRFTLRRNVHSCCWDKREEWGMLTEREVDGAQIMIALAVKADFWSVLCIFSWESLCCGWEINKFSFGTSCLWHLLDVANCFSLLLFSWQNENTYFYITSNVFLFFSWWSNHKLFWEAKTTAVSHAFLKRRSHREVFLYGLGRVHFKFHILIQINSQSSDAHLFSMTLMILPNAAELKLIHNRHFKC